MSRKEAGANASSWVVASRRSSALSQAPARRPAEEPNRRGRGGRRGGRGSGWRDSSGPPQPVADGPQEPPLCFGLKQDWIGVVIGESKRMGVLGRARREWVGPGAEPEQGHRLILLASNQLPPSETLFSPGDILIPAGTRMVSLNAPFDFYRDDILGGKFLEDFGNLWAERSDL